MLSLRLLQLLSLVTSAYAYLKGFNLAANVPSGACKTQADWAQDFQTLASLPGHFTSVRLYASSDCNTLANAVPAAVATGTTLLVGVWTEDEAHYQAEKSALLAAIQQYGYEWLIGASVGSEDLYRKETGAQTLVGQINDMRLALQEASAGNVQVGHVDTWTAWVDPANNAVITASDFVGTDGYPYFQNKSIDDGHNVFWQSLTDVQDMVRDVKPNTPIWVTETGWPLSGENMGSAYPTVDNAHSYWASVACTAFRQMDTFWYTLQDYTSSPSFGVVDVNFNPLFDMTCI